jgi:hypothetical protein
MKFKTNFLLFLAKASTDCIILLLGVRFIIFTLCNACAFTYRSFMEPICTMIILASYLVIYDGYRMIEWPYLAI